MKTLFENNMDMEQMDMFTPENKPHNIIVDWMEGTVQEDEAYHLLDDIYTLFKIPCRFDSGVNVDVTISIFLHMDEVTVVVNVFNLDVTGSDFHNLDTYDSLGHSIISTVRYKHTNSVIKKLNMKRLRNDIINYTTISMIPELREYIMDYIIKTTDTMYYKLRSYYNENTV